MKKDIKNNLLLDEFPILQDYYLEIKGGVFDLDTPAYNFYKEVFTSYLISCIKADKKDEIKHCFSFVERLLESDDELDNDLAMKAILTPLYEDYQIDLSKYELGEKSLAYYKTWLLNA